MMPVLVTSGQRRIIMGWHPGRRMWGSAKRKEAATTKPTCRPAQPQEPGGLVVLYAATAGITVAGQSVAELGAQLALKHQRGLLATMRSVPKGHLPRWLPSVVEQLDEHIRQGEWIAHSRLAQRTRLALLVLHQSVRTTQSITSVSRSVPTRCGARIRPRPRRRRVCRCPAGSGSRQSSDDGPGEPPSHPSACASPTGEQCP